MRAAIYDVDGTLMCGFVIVSFPQFLAKKNLFDKQEIIKLNKLVDSYFSKNISYRTLGLALPQSYANGVNGRKVSDITDVCDEYLEEQKSNIYEFSAGLIKYMKRIGPGIAITGSPIEPINALNEVYGFDEIYGTELEINNGRYTGNVVRNMIIKETKEKTLQKIVKEKKIDLKQSFGFGDTEQDTAILEKVGHPIALNPNENLLKICKERRWKYFYKDDEVVAEIKKILK